MYNVLSCRHKTECSNTSFANKLIVLDEFDGHSNFAPFKNKQERQSHYPVVNNHAVWKFLFFKRSYVRRHDGEFQGFPHLKKPDVYPLTYSIMESYIQSPMSLKREIEILCTLRGSKAMSTRLRVQQSVQKYIDAHPEELSTSVASQVLVVLLYYSCIHLTCSAGFHFHSWVVLVVALLAICISPRCTIPVSLWLLTQVSAHIRYAITEVTTAKFWVYMMYTWHYTL
jgi:hypothetical protein